MKKKMISKPKLLNFSPLHSSITPFRCPWISQVHQSILSNSKKIVLLKGAPDPSETALLLNGLSSTDFRQLPTLIVNTLLPTHTYYPQSLFPLTIGCALQGRLIVEGNQKRFILNETNYHIMNQDSFLTEADEISEAFRICFNPGFAEEVISSLTTPADQLLENPQIISSQPVLFVEKTYSHDPFITPLFREIKNLITSQTIDQDLLKEKLHILLERMLFVHRNVAQEISKLPAIKKSTRLEIYQRIHKSRNFVEDRLNTPLQLEEISSIASLSKHHFLRLFKTIFGQTPYQYIQRRRLEEFKRLLLKTDDSITSICYMVGFSDLHNLNHFFKRQFGLSPQKYREIHRKKLF